MGYSPLIVHLSSGAVPQTKKGMVGGTAFSSSCSVTLNHLCGLVTLGRKCGVLFLCPVLSAPHGECPHQQPVPNLHDTHCFSMGRQLIQELRRKQEKKRFRTKEKKVEMQGESAGEQARGKRNSLQQKQRHKDKADTTHASKQVNPDGRGAHVPSTLPRLGPGHGGVPRRLLCRAQTY